MIIRKYLVDDINEALFRIKHELGDDAYIISQKQVRQPGVKGFFSNKKLEVTVGLVNNGNSPENSQIVEEQVFSNNISSPQSGSNLELNNSVLSSRSYGNYYAQEPSKSMSYYNKLFEEKQKVLNNFGDEIFGVRDEERQDNKTKTPFSNNFNTVSSRGFDVYRNSEEKTKRIMDLNTEPSYETIAFNNQIASDRRLERIQKEKEESKVSIDHDILENLQNDIKDIKKIMNDFINNKPYNSYLDEVLYRQDICKELCDEIKATCPLTKDELMNKLAVKEYLRGVFSKIIKIYDQGISNKVVVVGPTGSGKTTTIAKLAGMLSLNLNKKVGLVTIDTFRVGAVEQLKMYGEIMNIPYKYVTTLNDVRSVFDDMRYCDVILVDTIGRSNKNIIHLNELNMFIQSIHSNEVTLVLSAGMKQQDLEGYVNSFKGIKFNNVIITKLDETTSFGAFVNVCYKTSLPISFVTVGQDVPLDIKRADKEEILDMILGE